MSFGSVTVGSIRGVAFISCVLGSGVGCLRGCAVFMCVLKFFLGTRFFLLLLFICLDLGLVPCFVVVFFLLEVYCSGCVRVLSAYFALLPLTVCDRCLGFSLRGECSYFCSLFGVWCGGVYCCVLFILFRGASMRGRVLS